MNRLLLILLLIFWLTPAAAKSDLVNAGYPFPENFDAAVAEDILGGIPLKGPEGLWEFAPDEVSLIILRDNLIAGEYGIYVAEAIDCSLLPGMKIGTLQESADSDRFRLRLMTGFKNGALNFPIAGTATLEDNRDMLRIEGKSLKISFTPTIVLPNLISLLRLRLGVKFLDPEKNLPKGLRKVFPCNSANGRYPIYL